MHPRSKSLVSTLAPTALFLAALALGAGFGYWAAVRHLRPLIHGRMQNQTLASAIRALSEDSVGISQAYANPEEARRHFDDYLWDVAPVLAPFVGGMAPPGRHYNAVISPSHFRNAADPRMPKPPGAVRIILLGGSTAFGSGAPAQDQTVGGYLESLLNRVSDASPSRAFEVFTLAYPAWASTQERIVVENQVLDFDPDLVVALSGINDIHWGSLKQNVMNFRSYADAFFWKIIQDAYRAVGTPGFAEFIPADAERTPPALVGERLERNVHLELSALEGKRVPLFYFFQPSLGLTTKPLSEHEKRAFDRFVGADRDYIALCHQEIDTRLRRAGSPLFRYADLIGIFDALPATDTIFIDSYHFGDKGNQKIAASMAPFILESLRSRFLSEAARAPQRLSPSGP